MTEANSCPLCGHSVELSDDFCPSCKQPLGAPKGADETVRQQVPEVKIPGYRILGRIGAGGMGTVYLAEEASLARRVAIKMIGDRYGDDPHVRTRFLREARSMATVEHPNVVRVYNYGEADNRAYIAMEYVVGEDLASRMKREGRLAIDDLLRITLQIVDALGAAWEHRIVHRDIKPSNVLLDRRGNVRVADFGLAKPLDIASDGSMTQSGYLLGTPQYISPEQAQGKAIDFRSDVYSLGIMLYHMLVGRHPFEGSTPVAIVAKHLHDPLPAILQKRPDVPKQLVRLIEWMTQKEPESRPASYDEIRERLAAMIAATPPRAIPSLSTIPLSISGRRERVVAISVATALFIILGAILFAQFRPTKAPASAAGDPASGDGRFAVAVAPFYGPDSESEREGRVMATLVERAILHRLGRDNVRVEGIDVTTVAARDHETAREIGTKLRADAVIWGEVIAYQGETEFEPHVTILTGRQTPPTGEPQDAAKAGKQIDLFDELEARGVRPVRLESNAPNQIELRKTSADGIGEIAVFLAGVHALNKLNDAEKALSFFEQAPTSPENTRYQAEAQIAAERNEEAIPLLQQLVSAGESDASTAALLGDLLLSVGRLPEAAEAFSAAASRNEEVTSTRGVLYDGKLYLKEMFRSEVYGNAGENETLYLLRVDPSSGRVEARWSMPGFMRRFISREGGFDIEYIRRDEGERFTLQFRNGEFQEELALTSNLLARMRSVKAPRRLATNYLTDLDRVREAGETHYLKFRLGEVVDADVPVTLPDLETELRREIDRDPTQPWYPFLLGHAIAAQGRRGEAEATWNAIDARDYPGVPYYDYAHMSRIAEAQGETALADGMYSNAVFARRRISQPPYFTTLIEKLISAPFMRAGAFIPDVERRALILNRASELMGPTIEGDLLAHAAWAKYFRKTRQPERERAAKIAASQSAADPINWQSATAKIDYALALLVAALASACATIFVSATRNIARTRGEKLKPLRFASYLTALSPWVRTAGLTLAGGLLVLAVSYQAASGELSASHLVLLLLAGVVLYLLRRFDISVRRAIASISLRQRLVIAANLLLVVLLLLAAMAAWERLSRAAHMPLGFVDGFGNRSIASELEKSYQETENAETAWFVAISHHYGGRKDEAAAWYAKAGSEIDVSAWTKALEQDQAPPLVTSSDLLAALQLRLKESFTALYFEVEIPVVDGIAVVSAAVLVMVLLIFLIPPVPGDPSAEPSRPGILWSVAMLLLPGFVDLRAGRVVRGSIIVFLSVVWLLPAANLYHSGGDVGPTPGFITAMALPSINALPMPFTSTESPAKFAWSAWLFVWPYAKLYWGFLLFALVTSVVVHVRRVPRILRQMRRNPSLMAEPAT